MTEARTKFLADVLVTAVEGGTNYWAYADDYKWEHPVRTSVVLEDIEDGTRHPVTIFDIETGLSKVCGSSFQVNSDIKDKVKLASRTNGEDGDIDAEAADVIVQAAIFGEIVYG